MVLLVEGPKGLSKRNQCLTAPRTPFRVVLFGFGRARLTAKCGCSTIQPIRIHLFAITLPHILPSCEPVLPYSSSLLVGVFIAIAMSCAKSLTFISRNRSLTALSSVGVPSRTILSRTATAAFSTSTHKAATPAGPPPSGFRLPPTRRWDQSKESSLDKASKYFLLTEIMRGMYVVLEQFFRPP